jgi:hypothetical protein
VPAVALGDIEMHYEERGAGHLSFLEQPEARLRLLEEFPV